MKSQAFASNGSSTNKHNIKNTKLSIIVRHELLQIMYFRKIIIKESATLLSLLSINIVIDNCDDDEESSTYELCNADASNSNASSKTNNNSSSMSENMKNYNYGIITH